jgi:hypothetical protein
VQAQLRPAVMILKYNIQQHFSASNLNLNGFSADIKINDRSQLVFILFYNSFHYLCLPDKKSIY